MNDIKSYIINVYSSWYQHVKHKASIDRYILCVCECFASWLKYTRMCINNECESLCNLEHARKSACIVDTQTHTLSLELSSGSNLCDWAFIIIAFILLPVIRVFPYVCVCIMLKYFTVQKQKQYSSIFSEIFLLHITLKHIFDNDLSYIGIFLLSIILRNKRYLNSHRIIPNYLGCCIIIPITAENNNYAHASMSLIF